MNGRRTKAEAASDLELVERVRTGDSASFGELWERHERMGRVAAAAITSAFDPAAVVAEAFARILTSIQAGGGPTVDFRSYLYATVRNVIFKWGAAPSELPIDVAESIEDQRFVGDAAVDALDKSLISSAFRQLPLRWQSVLWYVEVEQLPQQEVAPLLGMSPNAVGALAFRAREGLRQAWLQAHVLTETDSRADDHSWTVDRLARYLRNGLSDRLTLKVERHLTGCRECAAVADEMRDVSSGLRSVLLVAVLGPVGGIGLTAWLQAGGGSGAVALAANGIAPVAMPTSIAAHASVPGVSASVSSASALPAAAPAAFGVPAATKGVVTGLLVAAIAGAVVTGAVTSPSTNASSAVTIPLGASPEPTSPLPARAPALSPDRTEQSPVTTPPDATAPTPPATPTPSAPAVAAPTIVTRVDLGPQALFLPVVSGTSEPGTVLSISNGDGAPATVTADAAGAWTSPVLTGFGAGYHSVTATPQDGSPSSPGVAYFTLAAPPRLTLTATSEGFTLSVRGVAGATVAVSAAGAAGRSLLALDAIGAGSASYRSTAPLTQTVTVCHSDGDRSGPVSAATVVLSTIAAEPVD